jgi:spore photoproduct lyase
LIPLNELDSFIASRLGIETGLNKREEIKRLIYEIRISRKLGFEDLEKHPMIKAFLSSNLEGLSRFHALKEILTEIRFPVASSCGDDLDIYLPRVEESGSLPGPRLSADLTPAKLFIQKSVRDMGLAIRALKMFPSVPCEFFDNLSDLKQDRSQLLGDMGKRDFYIVSEAFDILKPCPCTNKAQSCNYFILNLGFGCPFDCAYCYLQHYSNRPGIYLPANLEGFFAETEKILASGKYRFLRIGTGEFSDSLALDSLTGYAGALVDFFRDKNCLFEFKTKSVNVEGLLQIPDVPSNIIVSWSLNPAGVIASEELYSPPLDQRLEAASQVIKKGYKTGFHFDPIIPYEGWEKDYFETIDRMFSSAKGHIAWISLGTLRFYRKLRRITDRRFPEDPYLYGELLLDRSDNKMRYPSIIRVDTYKKMLAKIRSRDPDVPVYLCMEPPEIWEKVFGKKVGSREIEDGMRQCCQ